MNEVYDFEKYIVICDTLVKIYKTRDIEVLALQGLDLLIEHGEVMAIIGNSGSGKSTLLNMIGGLDKPSVGSLYVNGVDLLKMRENDLPAYKTETVGFVWQNNARNIIPYLTALENVMMPMQFNKLENITKKRERAYELLEMAKIEHRAGHRLGQLSGGEQQRVAIAIALANHPKLLLADEPTGSVDTKTTDLIMEMFRSVNATLGTTIIIVTHDRQISKKVQRAVAIRDGKTSSEFIMKQSYAEQMGSITGFSDGFAEDGTQQEFAVFDRAGRVQIPKEYLEKLNLDDNKVSVSLEEGGKITIRAPER